MNKHIQPPGCLVQCVSAEPPHPLLPLRALVHEREEVEVRRVRLGLAGLDQPPDVAVDPGSGAALDQIGLVSVGAVPQLLRGRSHGPPLAGRTETSRRYHHADAKGSSTQMQLASSLNGSVV